MRNRRRVVYYAILLLLILGELLGERIYIIIIFPEYDRFPNRELPGKFTAKMLYGWSDKRYDQEYWERLERNWRRWKGKKPIGRGTMKMIPEEEEIEEEESGVREWTEEDDDEMGNMVDPHYEL